jgi:hypothetical protein
MVLYTDYPLTFFSTCRKIFRTNWTNIGNINKKSIDNQMIQVREPDGDKMTIYEGLAFLEGTRMGFFWGGFLGNVTEGSEDKKKHCIISSLLSGLSVFKLFYKWNRFM